ncbi:hypothetical protein DT019_36665 [Streptomyces sp. SDr-06]|nr:hypothetical protein DT019_36665 [Streptomyces sp. SDr-06]
MEDAPDVTAMVADRPTSAAPKSGCRVAIWRRRSPWSKIINRGTTPWLIAITASRTRAVWTDAGICDAMT